MHKERAGGRDPELLRAFHEADYQRVRQRYGRRGDSRKLEAQRWESLVRSAKYSGDNDVGVHRLLAYEPLPAVASIDTAVFRYFAGEPVNDQDGSVGRAIAQIERAEKAGRPIMLLFHDNWYAWRTSRNRAILRDSPAARFISQFEVVNLPAREMPALSAQLPGFTVPEKDNSHAATIVLADCQRNHMATVGDRMEPAAFASALARALAANDIVRAEQLVGQNRMLDARRHLIRAHKSEDQLVVRKAGEMLASLEARRAR